MRPSSTQCEQAGRLCLRAGLQAERGKTAEQYAREKGDPAVLREMEQYSANPLQYVLEYQVASAALSDACERAV